MATLRKGMSGIEITRLQKTLIKYGIGLPKYGVDGSFGNETENGVKAAQKRFGIDIDGIVGPVTRKKLGLNKAIVPKTSLKKKLDKAMQDAKNCGLRITCTTGGIHVKNSYHYKGRAFDCAGSAANMKKFYHLIATRSPTELFYDPCGGIKHGKSIGAIGGHVDHVHVAF